MSPAPSHFVALRLELPRPSCVLGVGTDDAEPRPKMTGTKLGGANNFPETIIPDFGQSTGDGVPGASVIMGKDSWGVFKYRVVGSKQAKESDGVGPKPARVSSTQLLSEEANSLAWNAARKEFNRAKRVSNSFPDSFDAAEVWDTGPPVAEHLVGVGIDFAEGDCLETLGFGGKAEATLSTEEVEVGWSFISHAVS